MESFSHKEEITYVPDRKLQLKMVTVKTLRKAKIVCFLVSVALDFIWMHKIMYVII